MNTVAKYSWRRAAVGIFAIVCFVIGVYQTQTTDGSSVMGRSVFFARGGGDEFVMGCLAFLATPRAMDAPGSIGIRRLGIVFADRSAEVCRICDPHHRFPYVCGDGGGLVSEVLELVSIKTSTC